MSTMIIHEGRRVALKWHRLRTCGTDPVFGVDMLHRGLELGASMEIDLRVTADGDFVVLHDETVDRETSGSGKVAAMARDQLALLSYDDQEACGRKLLFVEELPALLSAVHGDALLQFDMKDDFAAIGDRGLATLSRYFGGSGTRLVASGECARLISCFRECLPEFGRGIDPSERLADCLCGSRGHDPGRLLASEIRGPTEPGFVYLAWQLILAADQRGLDLVGVCHDHGIKVDAWTFNLADPQHGFSDKEWSHLLRLLELGVDQITTDEATATEDAYRKRCVLG